MSDTRILNRPSPSESATWYQTGTYKKGNDGNIYGIQVTNSGVHRWIQVVSPRALHEIFSTKHPNYGQQTGMQPVVTYTTTQPPKGKHKFNIGDKVRVVTPGYGCGPEEEGMEVTIVKKGFYSSHPGYEVYPPIGNSDSKSQAYSFYNGMIHENSFELVEQQIITPKPLKMAKTKSITKRTTQEVRNIETSLINKEEVFKMLALAEATGLPLLLVGEPGVL